MRIKFKWIAVMSIILTVLLTTTCFAITDSDVQAAVDAEGKDAVTGNLLVWFLCAIGFLKVSQRIDSFMSSLGISVGHTGGSMLGDAMIAINSVGAMFRGGKGLAGFGKHTGKAAAAAAAGGGIFGGINSKMSNSVASAVTGMSGSGGGLMAAIGKSVYNSSVSSGGKFATNVIGAVARGDISQMGTITGKQAKSALESYLGYNTKQTQALKTDVTHGGATSIKSDAKSSMNVAGGTHDTVTSSINVPDGSGAGAGAVEIPKFSCVEIGGGRITGFETTKDYPNGREFAMYDVQKYGKPEGEFKVVKAADDSVWYKQYAQPVVDRKPQMGTDGKITYKEKIVPKMPKAPMRKDKM